MKIKSNLYTTGIVSLLFALSHGANLRADGVTENNDSEPSQEMAFKVASTGESNRSYASRLRKYHLGMDFFAALAGWLLSIASYKLLEDNARFLDAAKFWNPNGYNLTGACTYLVLSFLGRLIMSYKIKPKN